MGAFQTVLTHGRYVSVYVVRGYYVCPFCGQKVEWK